MMDLLANETLNEGPSSDAIVTATNATFGSLVLEASGPIAVEFMSYGCGYCRTLEPILQHVANVVKTKERIFRVNVPVEPELASAYEIDGTPTLVMFLNGIEVGRVAGPHASVSSLMTAVTFPFRTSKRAI